MKATNDVFQYKRPGANLFKFILSELKEAFLIGFIIFLK